ncbi:MAG TPA: VOC family protein [Myxococcota bacterium]|nr:VOC family protein [Myxococcota bacterium]
MSLVHALDHAIVLVRDLEAASADYGALLGRSPSWRGSHAALGTANALFRVRNCYLELLAPAGSSGISGLLGAWLDERGEGALGFALGTDDAQRCADGLRKQGVSANDPSEAENREARTGVVRRWRHVMLPPSATRGLLVFAVQHLSPPDALQVAAPVCDEREAVSALDHLVIQSDDLEAARELYGDAFGIRLALDRSFPERGARILFFRIGGATIEVAGRAGPPPRVSDAPDALGGLAWQVPDAEAARSRLAAAGFDVSETRPGRKSGTRVCTVRSGTHGVPTLLIEPAVQAATM